MPSHPPKHATFSPSPESSLSTHPQVGLTLRDDSRSVQKVGMGAATSEALSLAEQQRLEIGYLNSAQEGIWAAVVEGNLDAIEVFLRISDRRVKLLGLATRHAETSQDWVVKVVYQSPNG